MKRSALKLLLLVMLVVGWEWALPATAIAGPPATSGRSSAKKKQHAKKKTHQRNKRSHRKAKRKLHASKGLPKEQAIAVLREHLPNYADIHETKLETLNAVSLPLPANFDTRSPYAALPLRFELLRNINEWLGTRYRFGGSSKRGVDCSGFTSNVVSATLKHTFAGSSRVMADRFAPIFDVDSLQFGDLIFFTGRNRKSGRIGHVGVFIGDGVFAHSSTGRGVLYSHITEGYYAERFRWGGRFLRDDVKDAKPAHTVSIR
jgi:cell wall-associated NlpC family hydrolase